MGGPARLLINHAVTQQGAIDRLVQQLVATLQLLECRYSRYREDSLITQINQRAGTGIATPVDEETSALLDVCDVLWFESGGLFDPTSGVLRRAWDFRLGKRHESQAITDLLPLVGWSMVNRSADGVYLERTGMELDFGGLVKEYAADVAATLIRQADVNSALIELAGDIVAIGTDQDGLPWQIGIRDPEMPERPILSVTLVDAALATSGNYARQITLNDQRFSHLLDPRTGWPVVGARSVSVIGADCLAAGAIATVACLKCPDDARSWLSDAGLPWLMVDDAGERDGPLAEIAAKGG